SPMVEPSPNSGPGAERADREARLLERIRITSATRPRHTSHPSACRSIRSASGSGSAPSRNLASNVDSGHASISIAPITGAVRQAWGRGGGVPVTSLSAIFLEHVPAARRERFASVPDLDGALAGLAAKGRAVWTEVPLAEEDFAAFLGRCLPEDAAADLA